MKQQFSPLLQDVQACDICHQELPLRPRPILQLHHKASLLIAGQAPGRKVHETGYPLMIRVEIDFRND